MKNMAEHIIYSSRINYRSLIQYHNTLTNHFAAGSTKNIDIFGFIHSLFELTKTIPLCCVVKIKVYHFPFWNNMGKVDIINLSTALSVYMNVCQSHENANKRQTRKAHEETISHWRQDENYKFAEFIVFGTFIDKKFSGALIFWNWYFRMETHREI